MTSRVFYPPLRAAVDLSADRNSSHALRPHPIDNLISPALRRRLAQLDPLVNLDRAVRLITVQRPTRRHGGAA